MQLRDVGYELPQMLVQALNDALRDVPIVDRGTGGLVGPDGAVPVANFDSEGRLVKPDASLGDLSGYLRTMAWFTQPHRARAHQVVSGTTPYLEQIDMTQAVVPTGATHTELASAITNAAALSSRAVVLVTSNITLAANVTLSGGVTLVSLNGAKILGSGYSVVVQTGATIAGLTFDGANVGFDTANGGMRRVRIVGNRFINSPASAGAVREVGNGDNSAIGLNTIALNEFEAPAYGIWIRTMRYSQIERNKLTGTRGAGRAIYLLGGVGNSYRYNLISGFITGILALVDRSQSRGFNNNVLRGNWVDDCSEEGLALDCQGNSAEKMSVVDRLTVSGSSGSPGSNPSIIVNRTATTGISSLYAFVVLTGSLAGRSWPITAVAAVTPGSTIRLQVPIHSITTAEMSALSGAQVGIQIQCLDNIIDCNTVRRTYTPVSLWGIGHNTKITGNDVKPDTAHNSNMGIRVNSLGGLSPDVAEVADGGCLAVPSRTLVYGNSLGGADLEIAGTAYSSEADITGFSESMPTFVGGNSAAAIVTNWKRNNQWTSTLKPGAITDTGEVFAVGGLGAEQDELGAVATRNRSGIAVRSGNGSATAFTIQHMLNVGMSPSCVMVTPGSEAARADHHVTANETTITITYATAPASATDNIVLYWRAEL